MTDHILTPQAPTRAEFKPLIRLAVPLMVGLAAALLIGVVDTAMISPLGTVPLAAAGITTAVLIILISSLWGVVTVISVQISQADGGRRPQAGRGGPARGASLCLLGGSGAAALMLAIYPLLGPLGQPQDVLAILLPYWVSMAIWIVPFTLFFGLKALFDAVDWPWTAVGLSYLGVLFNIPANLSSSIFWSLEFWAQGLPASCPMCVACGRMGRFIPRIRIAGLSSKGHGGLGGCPGAIQASGSAVSWIRRGGRGLFRGGCDDGLAGGRSAGRNQIVNALAGLAYMIPLGMAGAASIRIGQAVGAGRRERLRPILKASFALVTLWQCLAAIVFIAAGRAMAEMMSNDPGVIELTVTLFILVALLQVADGIQGTALGALRGMSDMNVPTLITLIAYWPLALPMSYLLGFVLEMGAVGVWLGYTLGLVVAALALPYRFLETHVAAIVSGNKALHWGMCLFAADTSRSFCPLC